MSDLSIFVNGNLDLAGVLFLYFSIFYVILGLFELVVILIVANASKKKSSVVKWVAVLNVLVIPAILYLVYHFFNMIIGWFI
jgi:hypothetical protein